MIGPGLEASRAWRSAVGSGLAPGVTCHRARCHLELRNPPSTWQGTSAGGFDPIQRHPSRGIAVPGHSAQTSVAPRPPSIQGVAVPMR